MVAVSLADRLLELGRHVRMGSPEYEGRVTQADRALCVEFVQVEVQINPSGDLKGFHRGNRHI